MDHTNASVERDDSGVGRMAKVHLSYRCAVEHYRGDRCNKPLDEQRNARTLGPESGISLIHCRKRSPVPCLIM